MAARKTKIKEYESDLMKIIDKSSSRVKKNGPQTRYGTVINTSCLKIRKSPEIADNEIGFLERGDRVQIIDECVSEESLDESFYQISYKLSNDRYGTGYVVKQYIREEEDYG